MERPRLPTHKTAGTSSLISDSITVVAANASGTQSLLFSPSMLYVGAACTVTFVSGSKTLLVPIRMAAQGTVVLYPVADTGTEADGISMSLAWDSTPSAVAYALDSIIVKNAYFSGEA